MARSPTTTQTGRWDFLQNWAVFVVLISILPVGFGFVIALFTSKPITWAGIFGKGELLVAALAVTADAAGSLHGKALHDLRLGVSNLCNIWAYVMVGMVSLLIGKVFPVDTDVLAFGSLAFFVVSLIFSVTGKIIAEG